MLASCRGHKAISTLVCFFLTFAAPVAAQSQNTDSYIRCSFYPQGTGCDQVYQQARFDRSPGAASVRNAFEHYARYLKPRTSGLTDNDKLYLAQNQIRVFDLDEGDLAGLHNVINDPDLAKDPAAKLTEVNGFIARAVQAELYCGLNQCRENTSPSG